MTKKQGWESQALWVVAIGGTLRDELMKRLKEDKSLMYDDLCRELMAKGLKSEKAKKP